MIFRLLLLALFLPKTLCAGLQVFPIRVYLNDQKRVANVSLRHVGKKETEYRISAVFYKMKPDGSMEVSDPKPEDRALTKFLRFSPRQTRLTPNVEQVVRILYSGPRDLPEGEYRAHLHFEPVGESEDSAFSESKEGKLNLKLEARMAVAIPVIFKRGKPTFTVTLHDLKLLKLPDKTHGFSVVVKSTGNAFPYGDFELMLTKKDKTTQELGIVRGVASYLSERSATYSLSIPQSVELPSGTVRLDYKEPEEEGGKVLASIETTLDRKSDVH